MLILLTKVPSEQLADVSQRRYYLRCQKHPQCGRSTRIDVEMVLKLEDKTPRYGEHRG